jgi:AcrR family transcriptional regulator
MRVKTENKRQAIMKAASEIFREEGFSGASMAMIAARVGGSKATLYNYFASKDELFAAITFDAAEATADTMMELLESDVGDIRETLLRFGHAYLDLILSPDIIMVTRIGISHGPQPSFARSLYEKGPGQGWRSIAACLQRYHDLGLLALGDSKMAALQLKGLLEAGLLEPTLFGVRPAIARGNVVTQAVDMFLARYGPAAQAPSPQQHI